MSARETRDEGFTLVELLIAMVIMGTAVVVLVAAMSSLVIASQNHRGYSILEANSRGLAEAVQQKVSFKTTLTKDISETAGTVCVNDATGFDATPDSNDDNLVIVIDEEAMRVKSVGAPGGGGCTSPTGTPLTVTRGVAQPDAGSTANQEQTHVAGTVVTQLFECPALTKAGTANGIQTGQVGYLLPDSWTVADTSIQQLDYLVGPSFSTYQSGSSTTGAVLTSCKQAVQSECPVNAMQPQCDAGVERILLTSRSNGNLADVSATLQALIRRGSP